MTSRIAPMLFVLALAASVPARAAPSLEDFFGTWETADGKCQSYRERTEGPYVTIGRNSFVPEGGGDCPRVRMTLRGDTLTIVGRCINETGRPNVERVTFRFLRKGVLLSEGLRYIRCGP